MPSELRGQNLQGVLDRVRYTVELYTFGPYFQETNAGQTDKQRTCD